MTRIEQKKQDRRIEALYYRECAGIQVDVMDIGKIFAAGHAAIAAGVTDDDALATRIRAFVETIRKN